MTRWFSSRTVGPPTEASAGRPLPPLLTPFRVRGCTLVNRVIVSPMAQYTATTDGMPTDWHLVHLGARAVGGAALVMTEMTCVSAAGSSSTSSMMIWLSNRSVTSATAGVGRAIQRSKSSVANVATGEASRASISIPCSCP